MVYREEMANDEGAEAKMRAMERLAEELVDASLANMNAELGTPLSAAVVEQMRWTLLDELLLTPEGRMRLRRALGDPDVDASDIVGDGSGAEDDKVVER